MIKKKLFTTVKGNRVNNLGLRLQADGGAALAMYYHQELICVWDLTKPIQKFDQMILVIAQTKGKTCSHDEEFHYVNAHLLNGMKPLNTLVNSGAIVVDFCIDYQPIGSTRTPHDRGPHIRIPKRKLWTSYTDVRGIL